MAGRSTFVRIDMVGDKALQRKLRRLPVALQKKIVRKGLRDAAKIVLPDAKARLRSWIGDSPESTGELERSLKVRAIKRTRKGSFGVLVGTGGKNLFVGQQFYGAFFELGTSRQPPRPFLRPALEENRQKCLGVFGQRVRSELEAEAKK